MSPTNLTVLDSGLHCHSVSAVTVFPLSRCFRTELDIGEIIASLRIAHIRNVCTLHQHTLCYAPRDRTTRAPLPCADTSVSGILLFCLCVIGLVELVRPPTASPANWARVYCGCKPGPTRVLPMPRQYGIGRRAPALRTLDDYVLVFEETRWT